MADGHTQPTDWMSGFPPAPDRLVRFADGSFYAWPQLEWSFSHMSELVPTKAVWRGPGASRPLPERPANLDDLTISLDDGSTMTWPEMLATTHTDALAVLHHGNLVYEHYVGACGPHTHHTLMSCNKSMVGTIAEVLIHDGRLDENALVPTLIPELADSAWGDATIRHVLDMVVAMRFHEDYLDPQSDVWRFLRSTGMAPARAGDPPTVADYLPTVGAAGPHGHTFAYREPNIFVLGWLARRAAQQDIASLASELVWRHIGAEHDWLYMVDASGAETTALATLRDFLRFGDLIGNGGAVGTHRVLPDEVTDRIFAGGDQTVFARAGLSSLPKWSYRSQWWVRHIADHTCAVARGAHGQLLYIDPTYDLVIARFGSAPDAPSHLLDPIMWPMVDTITAAFEHT